jgi:hypothetical protein
MSRKWVTVLIYHHHKLLNLIFWRKLQSGQKTAQHFLQPENLSECSRHTTGPLPKPTESPPHFYILLLLDLSINLTSTSAPPEQFLPCQVSLRFIVLHLMALMMSEEEYKLWSSSLFRFLFHPLFISLLVSDILFSVLFASILSQQSAANFVIRSSETSCSVLLCYSLQ